MPESQPALREPHRADVERLLEQAVAAEGPRVDGTALLGRARAALDEIAGQAAGEYAAYLRALDARPAARPRARPIAPALVVGVSAAAAVGADLVHGLSAGAALATGAAAAAAGAAATAARTAADRRAADSPPDDRAPELLRRQWLAALERRGVRPFLDQQRAPASPPAKTAVPAQQPPRRTDRSAAARQRAILEQSFGYLPVAEGPFAGRRKHLGQIAQWVHQARASTETRPVVVVLHGPAGSGRTCLAVRAARQLRDQFRGAVVVDLRGAAGSAERPLTARDALLHLLNRLEQYQRHLTGVPVTIVLDDAYDAEQIATLIPERSDSLVLVTTREPLVLDLPNAWVHSLPVGRLDRDDTGELLAEMAEAHKVPTPTPEEADRLRELCDGLPLALRIAGAALPDHGSSDRLAAALEAYGPQDPVDRVLALRYHDQAEPGRRLLRRLALAGRASLGAAAAAALLGTDEQEADRRLHDLARAGLIEHIRGSRYRPHDLIRRFAQARLIDEEDPAERAAAQERLIRSYAELANSVIRLVEGKTSTRAGRFGAHGFASLELALRWLDDESSFITAALRHTDGVDPTAVQHLLGALCDYCLLRGDLYRLGEISELAQAGRTGAGEDQNVLVRSVQWRTGIAARQLGELDKARSTLTSVVDLYFEAQHPAGAARALNSLGITLHHQGQLREAESRLREALSLQSAPELSEDRAWTQHALAAVLRDQGRLGTALELLRESLELHRENESVQGQAWAHLQLGQVYLRLGAVDLGEQELRSAGQSYALARDPRGQAWTRTQLARARLMRGEAREAARELDEAVVRHRACEDARGEAWTLYYLGQALEESGDADQALRTLERARTMFSRMRDVYGLACARHHSARVTRDQRAARTGNLRNSGFARQLLQDARQDFHRIGVEHGQAWSCVELAVIDAGNGRYSEALALLDEARELFAGLGDRRGEDWAVFLRCTVQPLLSESAAEEALRTLRELSASGHPGRDPDVEEYAEAYALLLERGVTPGGPWEAWRLGMMPSRATRMLMSVTLPDSP